MFPLNGPVHNMNSCKVMLAQSTAIKSAWFTNCSGGAGRVRFQVAKKRPAEVKELNAVVANAVKAVLTTNKYNNFKSSSDSGSEGEQEHFNF